MKLKTLRDLEKTQPIYDESYNIVGVERLRQLAIKWVKEDIEDMKSGKVFMAIDSTNRWMKRLDITERDLDTLKGIKEKG